MKEGEIVEIGNPIELFDSPKTAYTKKLIESIPGQRIKVVNELIKKK